MYRFKNVAELQEFLAGRGYPKGLILRLIKDFVGFDSWGQPIFNTEWSRATWGRVSATIRYSEARD